MKPTYKELEAQCKTLGAQCKTLGAQCKIVETELTQTKVVLKKALARILELEERLNKNSKNSSKPPSTDQKGNTPAKKRKKRKSRAGQNRKPYPPERINHHVECKRECCPHCYEKKLKPLSDTPFSWQQVDLPEIEAIVTQFDCLKYKCQSCHKRCMGTLPEGVPFSAFGPKLMAFISCLTGRFHMSKREAMLLLKDLYKVDLSEGSVINVEENVAKSLEKIYEKIHHYAIEGWLPRYLDETPWRNDGKRHYVWVGTTEEAVYYRIDPHRSQEALLKLIGTKRSSPAVTDRYNAYNILDGPRQYCLAHLIRDFHAYSKQPTEDGRLGEQIEKELRKICRIHTKWRRKDISKLRWSSLLRHSKRRLKEYLIDGIVFGSDKLSGLCDRLENDFERLWTFKNVEGMEPTNNMAERDLRKLVLWRKKSYGTRSARGQKFVERITSVIETLKKNNRSPLKFLEEAVSAFYHKKPAPFIAPALGF